VWIGDIGSRKEVIQRPQMMYRFATMHHYNECSLAAYEVDKKLEEGIDGEGL
jgi:hypothetical protein